jgi:hypothetical protein
MGGMWLWDHHAPGAELLWAATLALHAHGDAAGIEPGVWWIDGMTDEERLMQRLRYQTANAQEAVAAQVAASGMALDPGAFWPPL